MGVSRQNLQRIIHELQAGGLVALKPNPHHQRAHLVELTEAGHSAFNAAMALQARWVDELAIGLSAPEITIASKVIGALRKRLDAPAE